MSADRAMETPQCNHYWAWVSPAGSSQSARLCQVCHAPDPEWLNRIVELPSAVADQTDRDAVAATLAAHKGVHHSVEGPNTYCSGCDWQTYVPFGSSAVAAHDAHLTDVLAPLLAQARAEADTHREVAASMTGLWHAERDRADRLEAMCDRLAERLAVLPDLWREEGRGVMFNRDGGDLTPQGRVGKWLHDKTKVADFRAAVAEGKVATVADDWPHNLCGCYWQGVPHGVPDGCATEPPPSVPLAVTITPVADDALTDDAVGQEPSIVIVVNDPPPPPGPCPVTRGPHRWAWLTRSGQACGCGEERRRG